MSARFGIQLAVTVDDFVTLRDLARQADREGRDILSGQDHPYATGRVDAFAVLTTVLAETERLRVFPDVASLPMRGLAMLGKIVASLDLLSRGQFDLGLGAGAFWSEVADQTQLFRWVREVVPATRDLVATSGRRPGDERPTAGRRAADRR